VLRGARIGIPGGEEIDLTEISAKKRKAYYRAFFDMTTSLQDVSKEMDAVRLCGCGRWDAKRLLVYQKGAIGPAKGGGQREV